MTTLAENTTPAAIGNSNVNFTGAVVMTTSVSGISASNITTSGILENANVNANNPITNFSANSIADIKYINPNNTSSWFTLIGTGSDGTGSENNNSTQVVELIIS